MTKKKQKLSRLVSLAEKAKKTILSPLVTLAKNSQDYFFENE